MSWLLGECGPGDGLAKIVLCVSGSMVNIWLGNVCGEGVEVWCLRDSVRFFLVGLLPI